MLCAESERFLEREGNVYFPSEPIHRERLSATAMATWAWKDVAHGYELVVGEAVDPGAASLYPESKFAASAVKDHGSLRRGDVER